MVEAGEDNGDFFGGVNENPFFFAGFAVDEHDFMGFERIGFYFLIAGKPKRGAGSVALLWGIFRSGFSFEKV